MCSLGGKKHTYKTQLKNKSIKTDLPDVKPSKTLSNCLFSIISKVKNELLRTREETHINNIFRKNPAFRKVLAIACSSFCIVNVPPTNRRYQRYSQHDLFSHIEENKEEGIR
jgi:hypothetical protein